MKRTAGLLALAAVPTALGCVTGSNRAPGALAPLSAAPAPTFRWGVAWERLRERHYGVVAARFTPTGVAVDAVRFDRQGHFRERVEPTVEPTELAPERKSDGEGPLAVARSVDGGARAAIGPGGALLVAPHAGEPWVAVRARVDASSRLAVAGHGAHVAAASCHELTVFSRVGTLYERTLLVRLPDDPACEQTPVVPTFDASGRSLAVAGPSLVVFELGAWGSAAAVPLRFRGPDGWSAAEGMTFSYALASPMGLSGTVRELSALQKPAENQSLQVMALDASEFADRSELNDWGDAVFTRYARDRLEGDAPGYLRVWRDTAGRRNVEYAMFPRSGCDPQDRYVRFLEVGATLFQLTLIVPPGTSVQAALPALFDQSLGSSVPTQRVVEVPPMWTGPC